MNTIMQTLQSQSFLQGAFLLLLTAILVPGVKILFDLISLYKQKQLERQEKVIDYETTLLDEIDQSLWEYSLLVKEPAFYKTRDNEAAYQDAIVNYDQRVPKLLSDIRVLISKAQRLASLEGYQNFFKLYATVLIIDRWHLDLAKKNPSKKDWKEHFDYLFEGFAGEVDKTLYLLAKNFSLIEKQARPNRPNAKISTLPAVLEDQRNEVLKSLGLEERTISANHHRINGFPLFRFFKRRYDRG